MDRYLFQNRKTKHKSIRIQSSLANIRDRSDRVVSPQQLPAGQRSEHQIIDDSLNNDCIAFEQTATGQLIFAGITEVSMIHLSRPNIPLIL